MVQPRPRGRRRRSSHTYRPQRRWEPAEGGTAGLPGLRTPPPPPFLQGGLPPETRGWDPASTWEAGEDERPAREGRGGRAGACGLGRLGGKQSGARTAAAPLRPRMGASREPPPAPSLPVGSGPCSASGSQQEAELCGAGLALPGRGPPSPPASPFPAATHGVCRRRRRRSGSSAAGRAAGSPATAGSSRRAVAAAAGALRSRRLHRPGRAGRRGQPPASRAPIAPRGRPAAAPPRPLGPRPRLERGAAPPAAASRPSPVPRCNFPRRQWAAARSQPCSFLPSPPPPTRTRAWAGEQRVTAGSRRPVPSAPPPPFSLATGRRLGSAVPSTARPAGVRAS